jgi:hypothetical protein
MASSQGGVRPSPMAYPAVRAAAKTPARYRSTYTTRHEPYLLVRLLVRPERHRAQSCAIALRSPAPVRSDPKSPEYSPASSVRSNAGGTETPTGVPGRTETRGDGHAALTAGSLPTARGTQASGCDGDGVRLRRRWWRRRRCRCGGTTCTTDVYLASDPVYLHAAVYARDSHRAASGAVRRDRWLGALRPSANPLLWSAHPGTAPGTHSPASRRMR